MFIRKCFYGLYDLITCRIYIPYPFQWGGPTFNAGESFAMMAASVVSLFEVKLQALHLFHLLAIVPSSCLASDIKMLQSTGTFFATSRYGSATPVPASIISRGSGWLVRCVHQCLIFPSVGILCSKQFLFNFRE